MHIRPLGPLADTGPLFPKRGRRVPFSTTLRWPTRLTQCIGFSSGLRSWARTPTKMGGVEASPRFSKKQKKEKRVVSPFIAQENPLYPLYQPDVVSSPPIPAPSTCHHLRPFKTFSPPDVGDVDVSTAGTRRAATVGWLKRSVSTVRHSVLGSASGGGEGCRLPGMHL